ncbi:hypothetical protein Tco_0453189 [Tanacetum coccineum]
MFIDMLHLTFLPWLGVTPSVDEPEPQPLPNLPFLDVNLGDKSGTDPPINPYSLGSFRMKDSAGSHAPRVILFGVISAIIPVILEVPIVPANPIVTPKCFDESKVDGESEPAEQRPVLSSCDTLAPLSEFPLAPVVAPPGIHRRPAILVRPGEAIPFDRLYRTHLNGPHRHSSPDSSSSSSPSDHSLPGHTPPDTTDADSSTPHRFVHRSLARTP